MGTSITCCRYQANDAENQLLPEQIFRMRSNENIQRNSDIAPLRPNQENPNIGIKLYEKKQMIKDPQELAKLNQLIFSFADMQKKINRPLTAKVTRNKRNERHDIYYLPPIDGLYLGEWVYQRYEFQKKISTLTFLESFDEETFSRKSTNHEKWANVPGGIGRLFCNQIIYEGVFKTIFLNEQQIEKDHKKIKQDPEKITQKQKQKEKQQKKKTEKGMLVPSAFNRFHKDVNQFEKEADDEAKRLRESFNVKLNGPGRIYSKFIQMQGQFHEGVLNGKGFLKMRDPTDLNNDYEYEGMWSLGFRHGQGKETAKKFIYEGEFVRDIRQGKGKLRMLGTGKQENQLQLEEERFQLKYRDLVDEMTKQAANIIRIRKNRERVIQESLKNLIEKNQITQLQKKQIHVQKWKNQIIDYLRLLQSQSIEQPQKIGTWSFKDWLQISEPKLDLCIKKIKQVTIKNQILNNQPQIDQVQQFKKQIGQKLEDLKQKINKSKEQKNNIKLQFQVKSQYEKVAKECLQYVQDRQMKFDQLIKCSEIKFSPHHMHFDINFVLEHKNKTYFAEKYVGEFKEGEFDGNGKYVWNTGKAYSGQWKMGKMEGLGQFIWPNGAAFEGKYLDDEKHGPGIMLWSSFKRYRGNWGYGFKHGYGESIQIEEKGEFMTIRGDIWNRNELIIPIFQLKLKIQGFNADADELKKQQEEEEEQREEKKQSKFKEFFSFKK